MNSPERISPPWLRWLAFATALATLGLIAIGGLVTSKGAGMAVPDWPTSYGFGMFFLPIRLWTGGALYEHTHRLWASGVGFLTTVLAFWLYGRNSRPLLRIVGAMLVLAGLVTFATSIPNKFQHGITSLVPGVLALGASFFWPACDPAPRWLRRLGLSAFVAVCIQGLLGGLRVTQMADALGIFHGALAQLLLILIAVVALALTRFWSELPARADAEGFARCQRVFAVLAVLVFAQLILGASMRHQHAGLAIPDFPLAHGTLWPATDAASLDAYNRARLDVVEAHPITAAHIHLHMTHRVTAVLLLAAAVWLALRTRRALGGGHPVARFALAWCGLVVAQASLGVFTVWSKKAADIATLHVVLGALTLLSMALAAVCASRAGAVRVLEPSSHSAVPPHPGPRPPGEGVIASAFRAVETSSRGH